MFVTGLIKGAVIWLYELALEVAEFIADTLKLIPWLLFVVGIARVARKVDDIVTRIGLITARTGEPLGRGGTMPLLAMRVLGKLLGGTLRLPNISFGGGMPPIVAPLPGQPGGIGGSPPPLVFGGGNGPKPPNPTNSPNLPNQPISPSSPGGAPSGPATPDMSGKPSRPPIGAGGGYGSILRDGAYGDSPRGDSDRAPSGQSVEPSGRGQHGGRGGFGGRGQSQTKPNIDIFCEGDPDYRTFFAPKPRPGGGVGGGRPRPAMPTSASPAANSNERASHGTGQNNSTGNFGGRGSTASARKPGAASRLPVSGGNPQFRPNDNPAQRQDDASHGPFGGISQGGGGSSRGNGAGRSSAQAFGAGFESGDEPRFGGNSFGNVSRGRIGGFGGTRQRNPAAPRVPGNPSRPAIGGKPTVGQPSPADNNAYGTGDTGINNNNNISPKQPMRYRRIDPGNTRG